MADLSRDTRAQIWAALATVLLGTGLWMTFTLRTVGLWSGIALDATGMLMFVRLLSTEERRARLKTAFSRAGAMPTASPDTKPPPTVEKLREAILLDYWGKERYKASAEWNADEQQADLTLHRLDAGMTQTFQIRVFEPSGIMFQKGPFAQAEEYVIARFPQDFQNRDFKQIPEPPIKGDYTVKWLALIDELGTMSEVGGPSEFRVPHARPSGGQGQIQKIPGEPAAHEPMGRPRVAFHTGELLPTDDEMKQGLRLISAAEIGAPRKIRMVLPQLSQVIDDVPAEIALGNGVLRITRMDARGIELEERGVEVGIRVEFEVYT
jgi:hypothetical protein